jgi:hypothetical protein
LAWYGFAGLCGSACHQPLGGFDVALAALAKAFELGTIVV